MKQNNHFFILNKKSDFESGKLHNVFCRDSRLIVPDRLKEPAYFLSKIYDTGEEGCVWHRMRIECGGRQVGMKLSIYSTDSLEKEYERHTLEESPSIEEIKRRTQVYLKKTVNNQRDLLLHDVKGRYAWFLLEFYPRAGQGMEISGIRLYFPKDTWMKFLPEIYVQNKGSRNGAGLQEEDHFLEAFLGIFQSMYQDLNEDIKYSFVHYQPDACETEYLPELARWLHMENPYIWKEEQLRFLLMHNMEFYAYRGTAGCLLKMVELYTGAPAYVIEQHKLKTERKGKRKKLMDSLYGDRPYSFTLLVKEENVPTDKEAKTLSDIVKDVIPAHMECNMVVLRPYLFLDKHTYLGMNSVLGRYKPFDMKKSVILPFCALQTEQEPV